MELTVMTTLSECIDGTVFVSTKLFSDDEVARKCAKSLVDELAVHFDGSVIERRENLYKMCADDRLITIEIARKAVLE